MANHLRGRGDGDRSSAKGFCDMQVENTDAVQRWRSISELYAELAAMPHWEFQAPMVELTAWVAEQTFAVSLFPFTSHEWLCVGLHAGYDPDRPLFACVVQADGLFNYELRDAVGHRRRKLVVPFGKARKVFVEFVGLLQGLAADAEAGAAADGYASRSKLISLLRTRRTKR